MGRVYCKNAASSVSPAAVYMEEIVPKDMSTPPAIEMQAKYATELALRANDTIHIEADIRGKPIPVISWKQGKERIMPTSRVSMKFDGVTASLDIDNATKYDTGEYTICCQNFAGERNQTVKIKILDTPGPVQSLVVSDVRDNCARLTWSKPLVDGNSGINNYVNE